MSGFAGGADEVESPSESEAAITPPPFPRHRDLIEFPVSSATTNRFFVDGSTLSPGKDGIVRYVLVIQSAGGATNVSFEGLRCATGEYRVFATGRGDGSWAPARLASWRKIDGITVNRHHVALYREFFCPLSLPIVDAAEGREALRLGKHPVLP
ncbi:MAG: CNP1-like family protein [Rhodocyclaceae bacterium]|nr:CNP1-like family protein [Rhodocyclaceae bacterium]